METLSYRPIGPPAYHGLLGHRSPVAYSPDGNRIAVGARDGTVPVWNARNRELLQQPRLHTGAVSALAYSPDGNRIASVGEDNTVLVWEAATGRIVHDLPGHTEPVTGLAFSPDGGRVASSSMD